MDWLPSELRSRLDSALTHAVKTLLAARPEGGYWPGELSSSALSTATAVCALAVFEKYSTHRDPALIRLIDHGFRWLANHVNSDGGWGDTDLSLSNLSTTALCWAAFGSVPGADQKYVDLVAAAKRWLKRSTGNLDPSSFVPAVVNRYGQDRTFSVPILTMCALSGRLGAEREAWRWVKPLPFELGALPHRWFGAVGLPVVSYALPALIAIGQVRHHFRPTRNPLTRLLRELTRKHTLELLTNLQPSNGGFLEATPLTSFVTMSLAAMGLVEHPVTVKGVDFLRRSARADGSWPIDTNLATWTTTLSVNALAHDSRANWLPPEERTTIRDWLLGQQHLNEHPYTHAAPGGWAWTDLPGGVPDADDTAGALVALHHLGEIDDRVRRRAELGVNWLLGLQNRDGGIPTFCRGWGKLPFDRSSPDLTAHALRAWAVWLDALTEPRRAVMQDAIQKGVQFLARTQQNDGSWTPLWFGNQHAPGEENPAYGTARVVSALQELARRGLADVSELLQKGGQWLITAQNADGGWSGFRGGQPSVEETGVAVEALIGFAKMLSTARMPAADELQKALIAGVTWLIEKVESGEWRRPSPMGFYFARLWYYERLYPLIFTVGALGSAAERTR